MPRTVGRHVRVVCAEAHAECESALRDERTHPPETDDPEGLSVQLDAFPLGPLPPSGDERLMGLRNVAGLSQEQSEGVLCGRQDVRLRRVHDHHPETRRRLRIDVVETDAGTSNNNQLSSGLEHFRCDLGGRADHERVSRTDRVDQVLGRQVQPNLHIVAGLAHYLEAAISELLRDEYEGHCQLAVANSSPRRLTPSIRSSSASA